MIGTGPGQLPLRAARLVLGVSPTCCPPQAPQQSLKRLRRYVKRIRKSIQEREIGFVFQNYALFKHMTVYENIAFGLNIRNIDSFVVSNRGVT